MAFFTAVLETTEAPSSSRRRPKLVVKGKRRQQVRKMLNTLMSNTHQDDIEQIRSQRHEYEPMLLRGNTNSLEDRAMKRLIARCEELLEARS